MKRFKVSIAIAFQCLLAVGCSSNGVKPVAQLASAETAISQAEYVGARQYAPVDLDKAITKLEDAFIEFNEDNFKKAGILADEALVDANLAEAKASAAKTLKATKAMEESVLLLEESLKNNRNR